MLVPLYSQTSAPHHLAVSLMTPKSDAINLAIKT